MKLTRRDTIVIAIFVNLSLLFLLFAFSWKGDKEEKVENIVAVKMQEEKIEVPVLELADNEDIPSKAPVDEVDEVLQKYNIKQRAVSIKQKEDKPSQYIAKSVKDEEEDAAPPLYYTIKPGDNPWKLARKFHVKYEALLRLNNLDEGKAKNLRVGQKIRIR